MPRNRGRGRSVRGVNRAVHRLLKRDHLTTEPNWFINKTRNTDPPQYQSEPVFQRKIRAVTAGAAAGVFYTHNFIAKIHDMDKVFKYLKISRIDIYGQADGATITASAVLLAQGSNVSKTFSDTGVDGSRRSHISIGVCDKDNGFTAVGSTTNFLTLKAISKNGTSIDYDYIVDFHCQYYGNVSITSPIGAICIAKDRKITKDTTTKLEDTIDGFVLLHINDNIEN